MELPKRYNPQEAEEKWQTYWEKENIFAFDQESKKPIFSIDTPPPTVSGKMHMGHAFSYTQGDFIARYQRLCGKNVFYPFGTDDNGLATERLIEKTKGVSSKKMERQAFIDLCLETLKEIRPNFIKDWKHIGMSCDFNISYSTINDHCRKISQRSFVELHKSGRIYQKKAPIIFCPTCKTAIAQVEMEDVEKNTTLNFIRAKLTDGRFMIYATTRPELHPGCVGISIDQKGQYVTAERDTGEKWILSKSAVERMQEEFPMKIIEEFQGKVLIGKEVEIPFAENKVTISHDLSVNTDYGSGVVYYCSYGGLDCVEWMARHKESTPVHVMDESGTYTVGPAKGMKSPEARKEILKLLEENNSLIKKQKMKHTVNVHERCGTDIEYVATKQWFVKYLELREEFLKQGSELNWFPPHMKVRYDNWIKGLQWDWCISRQRHFGIPIPIWYHKETGEAILPEESQLPVDPLKDLPKGYSKDQVIPEKDVLDTWATSSMTPQLAIELFPKEIQEKLFPMNLRPQAHDIITFWLFNTLVKSQLHHNVNPWKDVVISGHAQDPHGKKMSKSKGNVVEPQVMIEKYSADALRFWAAGSKLGDDLPFKEKDLVTGMRFVNKLWNASKFSLEHLQDQGEATVSEIMDQWLLSKLQRLIKTSTENFEKYEYSKAKAETEKFFMQIFCDNYLEIVKDRLYNPETRGEEARKSGQKALGKTLLSVLKLLAPIMPHITEEIYQLGFKEAKSIHIGGWPTVQEELIDEKAEQVGDIVLDLIAAVRKWKSEQQLSLKEELKELIIAQEHKQLLASALEDLKAVTKVNKITFSNTTTQETEKLKIKIEIKK